MLHKGDGLCRVSYFHIRLSMCVVRNISFYKRNSKANNWQNKRKEVIRIEINIGKTGIRSIVKTIRRRRIVETCKRGGRTKC